MCYLPTAKLVSSGTVADNHPNLSDQTAGLKRSIISKDDDAALGHA